ncbi:MAG: copper chaperone PCu(A)C [Gemmatimonadetes bacterium]|nr:copper chaperone PCu(A)C [Gemmatimonadota bacterium]
MLLCFPVHRVSSLPLSPSRRVRTFRRAASAVIGACVIGACAPTGPALVLERAVLVPPAGNAPAALYFTMRNRGTAPEYLVALAVDGAGRTSMHGQQQHQMGAVSMAQMSPVASVPVPAGSVVRFVPGGLHGMVEDLRAPLLPGDSMRITARFASGAVVAMARVLPYEALDTALDAPTWRMRAASALTRLFVAAGCASCDRTVEPSAANGRTVYLANGCATCHGAEGHGDGPVAKTLVPPPRDFRDAASFKNCIDPASIAQTIAEGIVTGGAMPRFAHLGNLDRRSLALYVISLRSQPSTRTNAP